MVHESSQVASKKVDSLHDGHSRTSPAFVAGDVALWWVGGGLGLPAINGRWERMTDLGSFLDVAGTEAAVVLAGASDELGIDIEDLRHDFLEDGPLGVDLWLVRMKSSYQFHWDDDVTSDWRIADHKSTLRSNVISLERLWCLDSQTWDRRSLKPRQ
ncbi:hypothetical protein LV164_003640 [Aspergillus fumigatus]|nr:hypothetical protein KXX42_007257 [Aspergillus fumigatus]KAH1986693.1 hypothetical protein KXW88_006471 [Aspergillus fumigatus]KAH2312713.1 hypothetical protein KXV47_003699 [Aspergillus fumigatus]KAH3150271.1 hypothetical protein KXW18_005312 [Aspergillus fumigatus]KAH3203789.1 hypothetical protein KXW62_007013 [Aspergillus fumigatus]